MSVQIIRGNALDLPLADNSVDLVCTSPPYFGLRSYQDGGEHYTGQLGSEATPAEFVDALIAATREMVRVTKPCGSIFVNLGDKYSGTDPHGRNNNGSGGGLKNPTETPRVVRTANAERGLSSRPNNQGIPNKSLMGIPWRYALRCIDDLGLILRAEIIWSKPNGLPESVTDRVRRSHEQWFHFTLQPRYFSAVDEIREAHSPTTSWKDPGRYRTEYGDAGNRYDGGGASGLRTAQNPLGKLPGSVWTIPTQPLTVPAHLGVDHFAAFPMDWPRRIIQGWSPAGICEGCGEGRRPVAQADYDNEGRTTNGPQSLDRRFESIGFSARAVRSTTITGYACACAEPTADTRPAIILDPFGGTGTTALVAHALGRHGISVDMSADYCRLAQWRTTDRGQLAAAMQVDKPEPVMDGQADLFEEWTA